MVRVYAVLGVGVLGMIVAVLFGLRSFLGATPGRGADPGGPPNVAPGFEVCSRSVDLARSLEEDLDALRVSREIDRTEQEAVKIALESPPPDPYHQQLLLGRILLYDKSLSFDGRMACTSCHTQSTGFTSGVSLWNQTVVAVPSAVPVSDPQKAGTTVRIEYRKPFPYVYAAFSPVLHYDMTNDELYGGNFWDMRAAGDRTGNPAIAQAMMPPVDPMQMAMPDTACVVYRISRARYRPFFEKVWGAQSFDIDWPSDVEQKCSAPAMKQGGAPEQHLELSPRDRGISDSTYIHFATSTAIQESSPDTSPFSSKFDAVLAGKAELTDQEQHGWELFNGKAKCNHCHLANTTTSSQPPGTMPDRPPLFTDHGAHNIGVPTNYAMRYFCETGPDQYGFVANPQGFDFVDVGVADFLEGNMGVPPAPAWRHLAGKYRGTFRTPTLRDVDLRPYPSFVKSYFHNGYAKSLAEVVHFYNTSQALPHCPQGSEGEKVSCWPEPAVSDNLETESVGNLGLSDQEEKDLVAFLETLTDQWFTSPVTSDYLHPPRPVGQ